MQADYIYEIIKKIEQLSYNCILFDGSWGIGKTYAVTEALKEQDNVCAISMFGLQNSQQIYHEVMFQSALKNSKAGKAAEVASDILDGIASIWKSVSTAKEVIQSVTKEKELFFLLSRSFDSLHIIVIDDLERISDKVNLEEVLGIVEELKKCNYVKIILVANTKELQGNNAKLFERYNEKVIDRIYHITEKPQKINWGDIGIHAGFMQEFLSVHKVKNLRTLQKAQKFYEDVAIYSKAIDNQEFQDEIRLICFAIVVESTDNLYYKQNDNETDKMQQVFETIHNELENRIQQYLYGIKSGKNLVNILLMYYQNEIALTTEQIETEYKIFMQAGNKPNYYKSDAEIKHILPQIENLIDSSKTIGDLNRNVDEYVIWSDIIDEDCTAILEKYRTKVHDMLWENILEQNEGFLDYSYDLWHLESEKVQNVYEAERKIARRLLIQHYVEYLKNTTKGEKALEYSRKLREHFDSLYYQDIIKSFCKDLYNRKSFPVDEIDAQQYHTCYNIMKVLYHADDKKFLEYADKLSKECDKMSAHRMKNIIDEIVKNNI